MKTAAALLLLCSSVSAAENPADASQLTIEGIFKGSGFFGEKMEPHVLGKLGDHYFSLDKPGEGKRGRDLVRHDVRSGGKTIIASARDLTPAGEKKPLSVTGFKLSPDESKVLLLTDAKRHWRKKTLGNYWLYDLSTKQLQKLGGDAPPSSMMYAKFSPDATRVAYVCENNIHVQNLTDMETLALTDDGSDTLINGASDWVYEEELRLRDAFRWSPDGKSILYWQFDMSEVDTITLLNQTDGPSQKLHTFPYPTAGTKNSSVRLGVVKADGGATRWLEIPGDPREHYLTRAEWTPDGSAVVALQFNRLQNTLRLLRADPASGACRTILTDTDEAWVSNVNELRWAGDSLVFLSERSGWRHAYLLDAGGALSPITKGEYDVIEIVSVDAGGGWLYYLASPENATRRYLHRTALKGGGPELLSPAEQQGTHGYEISGNAKWAIHTFSNTSTPPVVQLVSLPDHRTIRVLKAQTALKEKLAKLRLPKIEFLSLDPGDGRTFDAWMITPPDLDPSKKYPLLTYVYGEPSGQTVKDVWGDNRSRWHWMLAQQGYVVTAVDTGGANSPRGRDFRKATYRNLGTAHAREQAESARALLERFPFLDPERVGIWGWSGGGSSALDGIFRYPGLYRTAISVAPVADRKLYDTIFQERYMGLPNDNKEGYRLGSPVTHAAGLEGNLLIVHGTGDDNVHYRGTEMLVNELIALNKTFTLMPYPNRDHSINTGKGTSVHLYSLMTRFLHRHLPPG